MLPLAPAVADRVNVRSINAALAVFAASMVMVQAPVPVQAPVQPVNSALALAVAVSVTADPAAYAAEQVAPQAIPAGDELTVPGPAPLLVAVMT
jgi:hypothetical protein